MWTTLAKVLGGPLIKKGFSWLKGKQDLKKQKRALTSEWELAAMRRSSTLLRVVSFVTLWGPLYHAYYLSMTSITIEKPEDVGRAVEATLAGFPAWWTTAAVTILLAVWGLKEKSVMDTEKVVAQKKAQSEERASREYTNR